MLLTLRGTPFLYYGEEIGQRNIVVPNARAFDPPARRANALFRWWNRHQCRGPLAWTTGAGGGFSAGPSWLPLPADAAERNVAAQAADPDSVLSFYRRLMWLRRATAALHAGSQELVGSGDREVLAYIRRSDHGAALVALNFSSRPGRIVVPPEGAGRPWRISLSTHRHSADEVLAGHLTLAPLEAVIALAG